MRIVVRYPGGTASTPNKPVHQAEVYIYGDHGLRAVIAVSRGNTGMLSLHSELFGEVVSESPRMFTIDDSRK